MGVRGLTSYIARKADVYLKPYELHDCYLVIDGDNLACCLYKDVTGTYSAFGGDYDDFYRAVLKFFQVLAECNVEAYVLMDGGYEQRKLRTVAKRLRGKLSLLKRINPCGSIPIFPLMMKEVFVDAVRESGVPIMRCLFEADDELAALGRKLGCPVLSYDSDFYIHNVRYIPMVTLTIKAHTKYRKAQLVENGGRTLRKNEVQSLEKRTKGNRILGKIEVNNVEKNKKQSKRKDSYKYLDCCIYRIENLLARGSLSKEKLPLFAALLGNDYISRSAFKNFFSSGSARTGRKRNIEQQQKRIRKVMKWLKHETFESALEKILGRLKKDQRDSLLAQVEAATSGYSNEQCHSYDFFVANYKTAFTKFVPQQEQQVEEIENFENESSHEDEEIDSSEEEGIGNENEEVNTDVSKTQKDQEEVSYSDDTESADDMSMGENQDKVVLDKTEKFPAWFLAKLYPANLPRFCVDLVHLRKYINNPQIEHFQHSDCNEIALPILILIFTLLNSVEGEECKSTPRYAEDGSLLPVEFTYLTRATRVTNIHYFRYPMENSTRFAFQPSSPDPLLLRHVFTEKMHGLNATELFEKLELLPSDLRLYFLSIVYWLQKSQHCDLLHLHALIICLVVLRTVDAKIPAERDLAEFQKRFGKIIKKERLVRNNDATFGVKRDIKMEVQAMSVPERMNFITKSDCLLVQEKLLKYFHMPEIFKKKYDLFSTTVLHAFAEFQSICFQLYALNSLLDFPLARPHIGQLFSGVFLYNLYDLLRSRIDLHFYVQNFVFDDSPMMFDFYCYLRDWCEPFVPHWQRQKLQGATQSVNKKLLKKKRQAERKKIANDVAVPTDPYADMIECDDDEEDEFLDLNNKFCELLLKK